MKKLDQAFWQNRYHTNNTGWDTGAVTTPLKTYFDQLTDKSLKVLIPGAGNAYEAEYLYKDGFTRVEVLDIAKAPLQEFQERVPGFPVDQLIHIDFFAHQGQYDLIVEQTFFCALLPSLRVRYFEKMKSLLSPQGKLMGLLFADIFLHREAPPFGEKKEVLKRLFDTHFSLKYFEDCYNSITPRQGSEVFFIGQK